MNRSFQDSLDIAVRHAHRIGKRRYIAIYGTVLVGSGMFLILLFVEFFLHSAHLRGKWLLLWLALSLLIAGALGTLSGWFQWWRIERRISQVSKK